RALLRAQAGRGCEGVGLRLLHLRAQRVPAAPPGPGARPGGGERGGERGAVPSRVRPGGEAMSRRHRTLDAVALASCLAGEGRGDCTVKTKILRGGGNADVLVDYRLRQENDAWRIIDVVIERVSLVANFRSQFQEIMGSGGPAKLLDVLREKNAKGEPLKS